MRPYVDRGVYLRVQNENSRLRNRIKQMHIALEQIAATKSADYNGEPAWQIAEKAVKADDREGKPN